MTTDFFPKVVVSGEAFCNRTKERQLLGDYIMKGRHVWIQAHRRHGKTSLVVQTVDDLKQNHNVVYERCHLRFAADSDSVIMKLIQSVEKLISQIINLDSHAFNSISSLQQIEGLLKNMFRKIKPSIAVQDSRPIISTAQKYDMDSLEELLEALDKMAQKFNVRACLLIDEFQEIGKINEGISIESVIRQAVEDATNTTYIFAGSEKTLMSQSFTEKKRPLYKHTQSLPLDRITSTSYKAHLSLLAQQEWGEALSDSAFDAIMYFTQRHPYYVNSLCDVLWNLPQLPLEDDVKEAWNNIVYQSEREDGYDVRSLSANDKKVVIGIAKGNNTSLTSAHSTTLLKMTASSVRATINSLRKRDIIDKDNNAYYIIDPALTTLLMRE